MIQKSLLIIIISVVFKIQAQEVKKDSLLDYSHMLSSNFITEKQLSIRAGVGLQDAFYTELGLALHTCTYGDTGFFSNDFYSAIEWTPNKEKDIYGIKVGYEANAYLLNIGLEVKYQTNFIEKDVVITPKIGLGLFGDVNIFYGYHISLNNRPFEDIISNHQIAIVFNFNNHFLEYR